MADDSIAGLNDGAGFFASISDSLRAHIDERLKSPFAGAFVLAWLAVNWQSILILSFSKTAIEDRISYVVEHHSGWNVLVFEPLGLSIAIAIAFYLCSAVFLALLEVYTVLGAKIERRFDDRTWVAPDEYMRFKERNNQKTRRLESLALDNLTELSKEKDRANAFSEQLLETKTELAEQKAQLASSLEDKVNLREMALKAEQERAEARVLLDRLLGSHSQLRISSQIAVDQVEDAKKAVLQAGIQTHPPAWNQVMLLEKAVRQLDESIRTAGHIQ